MAVVFLHMNKLSILGFPDLINNLKVYRFQLFEWFHHVSNALVQRKAAVKIVTVRLEECSAYAAYCHHLCFSGLAVPSCEQPLESLLSDCAGAREYLPERQLLRLP